MEPHLGLVRPIVALHCCSAPKFDPIDSVKPLSYHFDQRPNHAPINSSSPGSPARPSSCAPRSSSAALPTTSIVAACDKPGCELCRTRSDRPGDHRSRCARSRPQSRPGGCECPGRREAPRRQRRPSRGILSRDRPEDPAHPVRGSGLSNPEAPHAVPLPGRRGRSHVLQAGKACPVNCSLPSYCPIWCDQVDPNPQGVVTFGACVLQHRTSRTLRR